MEEQPDLSETDVVDNPRSKSLTGTIETWRIGTVEEIWDLDEDTEIPEEISRKDQRLEVDVVVQHKGQELVFSENMPFYDEPTDKTKMGKLLNEYGLEKDQEIDVRYDSDANPSITGIQE